RADGVAGQRGAQLHAAHVATASVGRRGEVADVRDRLDLGGIGEAGKVVVGDGLVVDVAFQVLVEQRERDVVSLPEVLLEGDVAGFRAPRLEPGIAAAAVPGARGRVHAGRARGAHVVHAWPCQRLGRAQTN